MQTRRLLAIPLALTATLALAASALAGGWATITVTDPPSEPTAGGETVIGLTVLQHGVTPVSWPAITVIARDAASGGTIKSQAVASGPTGHYTVSLTFPTAGDWSISFESSDLVMEGGQTFAIGAPPVAAETAPGALATSDAAPLIAIGAVVLLFLVAFGVLVVRDRRTDRSAHAPASGS